MDLVALDWAIVAGFFVVSLGIGLYYSGRAGKDIGEFFLSGRDLPWWLVGTSMVATTFAADTPLAVTGLVAKNGVAGNWVWWAAAIGSMLTVFFFARLWRRAGILTDVELVELRYAGRPAAILRGFRALYLGIPVNALVMGWVNLAMAKVLAVAMDWDRLTAVLVSLAVTGAYSALSGLWGVVVTDFFQFAMAMTGAIGLAVFALSSPEVGGIDGLTSALPAQTFELLPHLSWDDPTGVATTAGLSVAAFIAFVGVQWWASWYPGAEPGGGGYIAQRMMSARDERHSLLATLWFTVAHYCLRPWPWILVALASLVLYPGLDDPETGYVLAMRDLLPAGWRGLVLGAFFAAYMSTISTQLNWGTSYVVNDFYARFVRRDASAGHYVWVSRIATLVMMVAGGAITFVLDEVSQAWAFILESGAGIGLVLILRWYWWRVNAWSEITAMIAPALAFAFIKLFTDIEFPFSLFYIVGFTTVCWIVVTFVTRPEPEEKLLAFYRRVRPGGPGWARVARDAGEAAPEPIGGLLAVWLAGIVLVYAALFGVGSIVFGDLSGAVVWLLAAAGAAMVIQRTLARRGWKSVTG